MPMMPSRLPQMRWPSIQVGDQPAQSLSPVSTVAPSASRRGTARISAMVMSAVSSVSTPGVLVTVMPRATAAATSMLSTPLPKLAISLRFGAGLLEHRGVDAVGHGRHQHVGGLQRLGELGLAHRLVVEIEAGVEQLAHAGFDAVGQLARDDDQGFFGLRHACARLWLRLSRPENSPPVQSSLTGLGDTGRRPIAVRVGARPFCTRWAFQDKGTRARVRSLRAGSLRHA